MNKNQYLVDYHEASIEKYAGAYLQQSSDTRFTYVFENFFHPFVGELITRLNHKAVPGLFDVAWQDGLKQAFFDAQYHPQQSNLVHVESQQKEIDVDEHGSYAVYNWELFFHIPLTIAVHLSKNQRFAEAQRWFHFIFDPTSNDQTVDPPKRFWKFLAFRKDKDAKQIDYLLTLLSKPASDLNNDDKQLQADILYGYNAMITRPFQPHAIARTRHIAYQYCVVMKYLDNLIAWGDHLFQQYTVETINEATQLYVLAANLLGPRPQRIPPRGQTGARTFHQLRSGALDKLGNALVNLEAAFPFNLAPATSSNTSSDGAAPLFGIGRTFYFCIPRNDKLLEYWDKVADRLFKIRHCMDIQGVVRPLALFDPPIDPGMLVKAAAAGIDIGSIVNGLNQPVGPARCLTLIGKALELCSEVRSLGGALLSALEKGDGEHLALVRQRHELQIQQLSQEVKFLQWKSSQESTQSLLTTRKTALERLHYYAKLLGLPADPNAAETVALDRRELTEENFDEAFAALVGQYDKTLSLQNLPEVRLAGQSSPAQQAALIGTGLLYLVRNEDQDLNVHVPAAREFRLSSVVSDAISQVLGMLPDFGIDLHWWGLGGNFKFGGSTFAQVGRIVSSSLNAKASNEDTQGSNATKTAGFERRSGDWFLQYNLAAHELMHNGRQILTSLIAEQVAHHEYLNLQQQIKNTQEVDDILHSKFTNEELYLWMQGEISRLYYEYYRFAFDTARKAERAMKQELMRPELDSQDFIKFNYFDGGRKGLLAGEALHLDVKRMELAYHENNKRELELTRHVSLRQLDPLALLAFRSTGSCTFTVPEWLYDRDCPGHYLRRIKSVALSLPAVAGPYVGVHCTLSLLGSSLRKSPLMMDGEYARQGSEDSRFIDYAGSGQSIVTSAGSNDSGLFETNLRDDRYLPFEGAGAESTWKLALPKDYPAFDYTTVSDVILHVRYTARLGVDPTKVKAALDDLFQAALPANLGLLFSLRSDFSTEWSAFANGADDFSVVIREDYFPYFTKDKTITVSALELYGDSIAAHQTVGDAGVASTELSEQGQFTLTSAPTGVLSRQAEQIYLIIRYTLS